tara:strand:+ start:132390 stop:132581 length:192 start_codon:yes stop_codon:yes gene_type:complete
MTFKQGLILALGTLCGSFFAHWISALAAPWLSGFAALACLAAIVFIIMKSKKDSDDSDKDFDK